jgi:BirA family transcriptional regulator, biotin operon repressor / biotin---[acetyl-CoA-carboxylase] ligase
VRLARQAAEKGYRLETFASLGSTNDEALSRARAGDPGNLWIVAEAQSAGRGRHGRSWNSPRGNLYASLLLLDPAPRARAPELGFVAGVALAETLHVLLGYDPRLALKWPNDLVFDGAKFCGLLLEASTTQDGRFACTVGFGVNCASHPRDLAYPATDLAALGFACAPRDVFEPLSAAMLSWLGRWAAGVNFAEVREAWLRHAGHLGGPIRVSLGAQNVEGIFKTIDSVGRLVLETSTGRMTLDAGDVFLLERDGGPGRGAQDRA